MSIRARRGPAAAVKAAPAAERSAVLTALLAFVLATLLLPGLLSAW